MTKTMEGGRKELRAPEESAGTRLDRFVAQECPEISRTRVQELIAGGLILVDGGAAKGAQRLKGGERVSVEPRERAAMQAEAEAIPLDVIYEDEDLLVVNKPAGMTVHAGAGVTHGTLVNALLGRGQGLSQGGDVLRPGIVHRLDKETSGAIVVAKNDFAHARLGEAFRSRAVRKTYIALLHGLMQRQEGRIELAIGRDPVRRTRMTARRARAGEKMRTARTDWRVLTRIGEGKGKANLAGGATLAELELHTGRTHQIRVHLSAVGHPVVGDTLYGAAARLRIGNTDMPELGRNFLHAAKLGFTQPRTGIWIEVSAPLPLELRDYLREAASAAGDDWERIDAAIAAYL